MDSYLYRKLFGQARQVSRSATGSEKAGNLPFGLQNILSGPEQSKYLKKYKKRNSMSANTTRPGEQHFP
jgi:hypothetical protein